MLAVVLVGGEGTRLRPLTHHLPKPLLPIVERPIIVRVVEWLARYGIDEVVLSLAYQPDAFVRAFPDQSCVGVPLRYAVEPAGGLDTAGAIRFAAAEAGVGGEPFVVVNGDILTDLDLGELVKLHAESGAEATISLTPVADPSAYGVVPTDERGRVLAFIEKPPRASAPTNAINAGVYLLEPAFLDRVEADRRVSVEREVFPALVAAGSLYAMASDAYWLDTGTPERFLRAQIDVLSGRRPHVSLPPYELVAPGVRLAPGARLDGETTGPVFLATGAAAAVGSRLGDCVLGEAAIVEEGATVHASVLLAGAVMRSGALVDRSIVGFGAIVGAGATVTGESVIGAGAEVPAGARLDAARLGVEKAAG